MDKRDVYRQGRRLLDKHGLSDWAVVVDARPKTRFGQCRITQKEVGVSQCWIDGEPTCDDLDDLLLHEIAHALTNAGHNLAWKRKYAELLFQHFDEYRARYYLREEWHCSKHVERLLRDIGVEASAGSVVLPLSCTLCGHTSGAIEWSTEDRHLVTFDCSHRHTLTVESGPNRDGIRIRLEPGHVD